MLSSDVLASSKRIWLPPTGGERYRNTETCSGGGVCCTDTGAVLFTMCSQLLTIAVRPYHFCSQCAHINVDNATIYNESG